MTESDQVGKPAARLFRPVRWRSFPRDFAVIQLGFAIFGLGIAMLIRANLGTNPWVVLNVALAEITGLSVGSLIAVVGAAVMVIVLLMREPVGWGTLGNIVFIGPWTDLFLFLIPDVRDSLLLQAAVLLAGVWIMGLATALYIGVDAGAGPRDSLMLAIERVSGWSLRVSRAVIEITVVAVGWLLGGPAGIGTAVFALLIGPAVQWNFKLLGVPYRRA